MAATRIVANLHASAPAALAAFDREVLGLERSLDMGRIAFFESGTGQKIERRAAREGGQGTKLPAISIGVDDFAATEAALRQAAGEVVHGPVTEPLGPTRFHVRDPAGNLIKSVET